MALTRRPAASSRRASLERITSADATYEGGNVSTADLVRLAERVSGQDLDAFFEAKIYTPEKPAGY